MTKAARPASARKRCKQATVALLRRTTTVRSALHALSASGPVAATESPTVQWAPSRRRAGSLCDMSGARPESPRLWRQRPEALTAAYVRTSFDSDHDRPSRSGPLLLSPHGSEEQDDESPRSVLCWPEDEFPATKAAEPRRAPAVTAAASFVDEVSAAMSRLESPTPHRQGLRPA